MEDAATLEVNHTMNMELSDDEVRVLLKGSAPRACAVAWQRPMPWVIVANERDGVLTAGYRGGEIRMPCGFLSKFEMALMALLCFRSTIGRTRDFGLMSMDLSGVILAKALLDMDLCDAVTTPFDKAAEEIDDDRVRISDAAPPCSFSDDPKDGAEFLVTTKQVSPGPGVIFLRAGAGLDFSEISKWRGSCPFVVSMRDELYDPRMAAMLVIDAMESRNGLREVRRK
jgi:hypothetical protein